MGRERARGRARGWPWGGPVEGIPGVTRRSGPVGSAIDAGGAAWGVAQAPQGEARPPGPAGGSPGHPPLRRTPEGVPWRGLVAQGGPEGGR